MRYLIYLSILFTFISCSEKDKLFTPTQFDIDSLKVNLDYSPWDIIQYDNGYIYRIKEYNTDTFSLFYLNKEFEVLAGKTIDLNKGLEDHFASIWTSGDTLYGMQGYFNMYYWNNQQWHFLKKFKREKYKHNAYEKNIPLYEDENFIVRSCCSGEFGGAIYFYDKKTEKTFSCESTCVVSIVKNNDHYIITNSLPHLSGHSNIIKIKDPRQLYEIKSKEQLTDCSWYDIYPDEFGHKITHPMGYDQGYEVLLDSFDFLILGSFQFEDTPYYIYTDLTNSFVGYMDSNKLVTIDKIYHKPMWFADIRDIKHNRNLFPIRNRKMNGLIIVEGKKIRIVEFRRENN
ncbi:MAG: hypothetical protein JKY09_08400 [Crocinitomicaceae bacterium]|nr:hypothetical protein [Crocinitomicaceae bacterium]